MKAKQPSVSELGTSALNIRDAQRGLGKAMLKLEGPRSVMIVGKSEEDGIVFYTRELAKYLMLNYTGVTAVYVDEKIKDHAWFCGQEGIKYWNEEMIKFNPDCIDFVITIGGDGTVLRAAWLFQNGQVPPVLPFHLGSLGFLTIFKITDICDLLDKLFNPLKECRVNMRMRLACTIHKMSDQDRDNIEIKDMTESPVCEIDGDDEEMDNNCEQQISEAEINRGFRISMRNCRATDTFHILNDLVIDRGPSAYMSMLELFVDEKHLTSVQADGLVIATPTGSTAYSLSAGGSLVHPEVPSFLISPICAHSLSFRPMILPDTCELKIQVPIDSRNTAWVGFDGRQRTELKQGDYISVKLSRFPMPSLCEEDQVK